MLLEVKRREIGKEKKMKKFTRQRKRKEVLYYTASTGEGLVESKSFSLLQKHL